MPEQLLDLAQIGSHVEQVRRVAVAQPVRVHALGDAHAAGARLQDAPDIARTEPASAPVLGSQRWEEGLAEHTGTPARLEVVREGLPDGAGQRYHAFLSPLAEHANVAAVQVHVADVERAGLADAQAGAVEELDEGAIAQPAPLAPPGSGGGFRRFDQRRAIVDGKRLGQCLGFARRRDSRGRVRSTDALALQVAKEAAQRRELAAERRRVAGGVHLGEKRAHVGGGYSSGIAALADGRRELPNVGQIGALRVRRDVALRAQMNAKVPNRVGELHASSSAVSRR